MPVQAAIMCHAPVVIPAIAGSRTTEIRRTTAAMRQAAQLLLVGQPDLLVILSPHSPRLQHAFSIVSPSETTHLSGSFARFGFEQITCQAEHSFVAEALLLDQALQQGLPLQPLQLEELDHGACVPLWFLVEQGWSGPVVVVGYPMDPTTYHLQLLGQILAGAAQTLGQKWAICASGDMSHRLTHDAPAGYHPQAQQFDRQLVQLVKERQYQQILQLDPPQRQLAAEDAVDSLIIAMAASDFSHQGSNFLAYEGPFGVGYMEALLYAWT